MAAENTSEGGLKRAKESDIILLDIMMPVMDGYDVCAVLKKDTQWIFRWSSFLARTRVTIRDAASNRAATSSKPFSCERLLDIVKIVLLSVNK